MYCQCVPIPHRRETSSLRSELSQRHSKEQSMALTELAGLNDTALKQAQDRWEEDKGKLLSRVTSLSVFVLAQ